MAGKKGNTSTKTAAKTTKARKAAHVDPNERMEEHIRELTAIQAHADALALAVAGHGADTFRDNELTAALFDIEERLMHVRDGLAGLPMFTAEARHG